MARAKVRPFPKTFVRDVLKEIGYVPGVRTALKRGIGDYGSRGRRIHNLLRWEAEKYFVDLDLPAIVTVLDAKKPKTVKTLAMQIHKYLRIVRLLIRYKKIWDAEARNEQKGHRFQKLERAADSTSTV
ncbi:MAG: hypothetical protein WDN47_03260 [Candidatus Doudnabacteria bacterium]